MDVLDRVMALGYFNIKAITCCWTTLVIATVIVCGQEQELPKVEVGISDDKVHEGNEASITCRVNNQGTYKISIEKHVKIKKEGYVDVIALDDTLVEKYDKTGRFLLRKLTIGSMSLYILDMHNVSYEDTAKYVCKVLSTSARDHVNFGVYRPVTSVEFDKFQEGDIITFKEGIPREVSCTAFQSQPVADIQFKVGDKIQANVKHKSEERLADCYKTDEDNCLLHYYYNTKAKVTNLITEADDDGRMLSCEAQIQNEDTKSVSTRIEISVLFAPKIYCEYNHTTYSRVQYEVSCIVKSNPAPTTLKWRYSGDPTVKGSSEIMSGYKIENAQLIYSTHKEINAKEHEVTLHIPQVLPHHFTTFTLDVANIVGNSSAQVVLLKADEEVGDPSNGGNSSGVPFYAPVIVILSLMSLMCISCFKR